MVHRVTNTVLPGDAYPIKEYINGPDINNQEAYYSDGWATTGAYWETVGDSTPNFSKQRRKKALLPLNNYASHRNEVLTAETSWSYTDGNGNWWTTQNSHMSYLIARSELFPDNNMITEWLQEMNLDMSAMVTEAVSSLATRYFDAGTFLAELRKTVEMFYNIGTKILNILANHSFRDLTDGWMTIRYGLRPVLYDMQSMYETLMELNHKWEVYKERRGESGQINRTVRTDLGYAQKEVSLRVNASVRGSVVSAMRPASFRVAPMTTAWEAVRLSFVIDWFFNIGSILTSLEAQMEFPDMKTSGGVSLSYTIRARTHSLNIPPFVVSEYHSEASSTGKYLLRTSVGPSYWPRWKPSLSAAKVIDIIAIVSSMLRGK